VSDTGSAAEETALPLHETRPARIDDIHDSARVEQVVDRIGSLVELQAQLVFVQREDAEDAESSVG
jgi:hypothetical protein